MGIAALAAGSTDPLDALIALMSLMPLVLGGLGAMVFDHIVHRRRTRRRGPSLCTRCEYDLRGANHDRCPECGMPVLSADAP